MERDASAYAALGLEPGATPAAIERAYKRLIKLHHPDREGGDAGRAAEINRAYRELRGAAAAQDPLVLHDDEPAEHAGGGWVRAAMILIVAVAVLLAVSGPGTAYIDKFWPAPMSVRSGGKNVSNARVPTDPMDQPLHLGAINAAVRQALGSRRNSNVVLLASRDCHRALRLEPSVSQLDRCAAFDDAVVQLQDRDAMWDEGPFSQLAVTGRQWSAASSLSNDYLAIDSRLDRIRVQVELALAPPPHVAPPVTATPSLNSADELSNANLD